MRYFHSWVSRAGIALAAVAAALLLVATLIITSMVIKRALGMQNSWELELSIELMIAAIFLASPYTLASGGHVKMDLLDAILPDRIKRTLAFVARLAGCVICLYIAWEGLRMAQHAFVTGERALGIWQPLAWPKYATIPVGMFLTALQYVSGMFQDFGVRRPASHQEAAPCPN